MKYILAHEMKVHTLSKEIFYQIKIHFIEFVDFFA